MFESLKNIGGTSREIPNFGDRLPIRGEVLNIESLSELAAGLANEHEISTVSARERNLLGRLEENHQQLLGDYDILTHAAQGGEILTPAADWLVDNVHIVEEQLREVRQDLPRKFYRELPEIKSGMFKGFPRIFHVGIELIAHTDNKLELNTLETFIAAYQQQSALSIGELWAFPISLRLGLVENLRRYADRIVQSRNDRNAANKFADTLAQARSDDFSAALLRLIAETFETGNIKARFSPTYISQLATRLREGNRVMIFALETIEKLLQREGDTLEHLTHIDHNRQAAAQVSVANIITSMRLLSTLDWREFFEHLSLVDRELERDPRGVYQLMDFATRDSYRHQIERIAKRTSLEEVEVARRAVEFSKRVSRKDDPFNDRRKHVGYFLSTDEGLNEFEDSLGYRPRFKEYAARLVRSRPAAFYIVPILLLTAFFVLAITYLEESSVAAYSLSAFFLAALLAITPAGEIAITLYNWLINLLLKPHRLPKMDFRSGIPRSARTMVVIPTLLSEEDTIQDLFERLEIYYLANRDDQIYFALLGDLTDADAESKEEDVNLRQFARQLCARLNQKYSFGNEQSKFFFFSRRRAWNESGENWICHERKRGNLHEFNRLLRGDQQTSFHLAEPPDLEFLKTVRYVITLDADTQLPRDAARRLIGTIEHPLNRPVFDKTLGRVVAGYGILQPRIEISLTSAFRSRFARIYSGSKGFDPYTTAVSDVYQDLFGEGNYVGKGLYDIDAFEAALDRRIPENKLLSHDLFEGLYARVALLTDIILYDDYPTSYDSFSQRLHRWTRGDWQIARWILPFVPDSEGKTVRNRLPMVARWKILDNLRRSLVAPSILIWLIFAWTILPISPLATTVFALIALTAPLYLQLAKLPVREPTVGFWRSLKLQIHNTLYDLKTSALQLYWRFVFLVHEAYTTTDAILRVVYRKFISGKRLLEWVTAAKIDKASHRKLDGYIRTMFFSPAFSVLLLAILAYFYPENIIYAAPFLIFWFFAPLLAFTLSRPFVVVPSATKVTSDDRQWLRLIARRTWRYFEEFVGEHDHWLPPDNFQEDPFPVIAHRTSPTNIGLLLLSTLSARDFGYVGTLETIERIELTCMTLERLPRFRGHFYNWYDTQTLQPLHPEYISTVDSGNLAGHLIAVAQGCEEFAEAPPFDERTFHGLLDTLRLLEIEARSFEREDASGSSKFIQELSVEIENADTILQAVHLDSPQSWQLLFEGLGKTFNNIGDLISAFKNARPAAGVVEIEFWTTALIRLVKNYRRDFNLLLPAADVPVTIERRTERRQNFQTRVKSVAGFLRRLVEDMDFDFLYDEERKVLTIGYRPTEGVRDNSFYDLLASEARLASFIAIASGDVQQEHWFRLGRRLVGSSDKRALISWSGTMFEYLMPLLVMRDYQGTLLSETYRAIVRRQIDYGQRHNVAWGVSESAYNARDLDLNYQYGPFGVPGLGLKRGLAEDLVVSPYATLLALSFDPKLSVLNLRRLVREGMYGRFGFYEAVDYTKERLPPEQRFARIESYMTHHQGMIMVSLDNFLNDDVMVHRFHREPMVESADLLLQERIPRLSAERGTPRAAAVPSGRRAHALVAPVPRRYTSGEQSSPPVCLLSNGSYTVMVTSAGSGFSRVGNRSVTRWREDAVRDNWGQFFYLRDVRSGALWSSGFQPVLRHAQDYEAVFSESKASFKRRDAGVITQTEIVVSTEDDAELRRLTLINELNTSREIEVTSYYEVVLIEQAADEAHPAFTNLFVETDYDAERHTLLAKRRRRSPEEKEIWAAQTVSVDGGTVGEIEFETDRSRFLGRGRTTQNPAALASDGKLSGTVGATLDPIFALRVRVLIPPNESVNLTFANIVDESREKTLAIADKYRQPNSFERTEKLTWTRSQVELRHLGISADEANLFQRLAGHLIYTNPQMRPRSDVLSLNRGTQQTLWKYGISGDLPIMILRVGAEKNLERSVSQILAAHQYLRMKGLIIDLVIFNDQPTTYAAGVGEELLGIIRRSSLHSSIDKNGGIFIRRSDEMPEEDRIALHSAAKACVITDRGTLEEQLARRGEEIAPQPMFIPREALRHEGEAEESDRNLIFPNEFGGFSEDGSEYIIKVNSKNGSTPAPWSNVIANAKGFGFIATESGIGTVWSVNSRENRLTPWTNDTVENMPSECIYLRDEATGSFWTPTALPIRESSPYSIRHGTGYTTYEYTSHGIKQELLAFAAVDRNTKILRLRVRNLTERRRELSATFYCDLVLGVDRAKSAPFLHTEIDSVTGAILVRNRYNAEFSERIAFVAADSAARTWTCDRREFLGRNGSPSRPAAMFREKLAGAIGAGLDPCAAIQTKFELRPDEERTIIFLFGEEETKESVRETILRFRLDSAVENEIGKVSENWNRTLTTIQVTTPDEKLNLLLNRWLLYQTLSCRFWARSSVYQSSGAFGFRDQLQDAMSLVYARPELARQHILRAASRQFKEGDVQHWWHEPSGAGTRTRISDNLVWLVFVTCFYVEKTGDEAILEEVVPFLDAPLLAENEMEVYLRPVVSVEKATLFEHCVRAIEKSMATGGHGLPLIGAGDWSDGLNRVGVGGKGESVWMGWFLGKTLNDFAEVCEGREDHSLADKYRGHGVFLQNNLNENAWDGEWYIRAFFDDGTPLGSHKSDECRIDSLAQSWSIISGLGDRTRDQKALESVEEYLIRKHEKLVLLLTPPFDKTELEPGYIKGYPPGIRENGGQYTHAAAWLIIAYVLSAQGEKAYELFSLINPIDREPQRYKTEPFVIAADVYSNPQHVGRGGWSWYTGAAGWLYRAVLEYILGFQKEGDYLKIEPCLPPDWQNFEISYRFGETAYRIRVEAGSGRRVIFLDGERLTNTRIPLVDDKREHLVRVVYEDETPRDDSVATREHSPKGISEKH